MSFHQRVSVDNLISFSFNFAENKEFKELKCIWPLKVFVTQIINKIDIDTGILNGLFLASWVSVPR